MSVHEVNHPMVKRRIGLMREAGMGGLTNHLGGLSLHGVSLCGIAAILLNLILPRDKEHDLEQQHTS